MLSMKKPRLPPPLSCAYANDTHATMASRARIVRDVTLSMIAPIVSLIQPLSFPPRSGGLVDTRHQQKVSSIFSRVPARTRESVKNRAPTDPPSIAHH